MLFLLPYNLLSIATYLYIWLDVTASRLLEVGLSPYNTRVHVNDSGLTVCLFSVRQSLDASMSQTHYSESVSQTSCVHNRRDHSALWTSCKHGFCCEVHAGSHWVQTGDGTHSHYRNNSRQGVSLRRTPL